MRWLISEGHDVTAVNGDPGLFGQGYDQYWLSCIFSWDAPLARDIALRHKDNADVFCGGPGMFALGNWWKKETGLSCTKGLDQRFERQRGRYVMNFASRGCPVNCSFCIVPRLEGTEFTLDYDFDPAPVLCDNNLSALPDDFQEHILSRYRKFNVPLRDCNSGFEPRTFTFETYRRWKNIMRGAWRFAFDTTDEEGWVKPMMNILLPVRQGKKRVYCLIGNEPFDACYERFIKIIEWGGEPYVQPVMPLNALSKNDIKVNFDWTYQELRDFARFSNIFLWRSMHMKVYKPRKNEPPSLAHRFP